LKEGLYQHVQLDGWITLIQSTDTYIHTI